MSRHGFLLTEVGREVHRRIEDRYAVGAEDQSTYDRGRIVSDQCDPDRGSSTGHVTVVREKPKFPSSNLRARWIATPND